MNGRRNFLSIRLPGQHPKLSCQARAVNSNNWLQFLPQQASCLFYMPVIHRLPVNEEEGDNGSTFRFRLATSIPVKDLFALYVLSIHDRHVSHAELYKAK